MPFQGRRFLSSFFSCCTLFFFFLYSRPCVHSAGGVGVTKERPSTLYSHLLCPQPITATGGFLELLTHRTQVRTCLRTLLWAVFTFSLYHTVFFPRRSKERRAFIFKKRVLVLHFFFSLYAGKRKSNRNLQGFVAAVLSS